MARKATRNAAGDGNIRKKTVIRNGKEYHYWEGRYTAGKNLGTGKQNQKSITGKTQAEVKQKLRAITAQIDEGSFIEPSKMTLGEWLDVWSAEYINDVKDSTKELYKSVVRVNIKPALGAVKLSELYAPQIQAFYNRVRSGEKPLSPKSIKNIHGILHRALQQAVEIGSIRFNPSDACKLPRVNKEEIHPLTEEEVKLFLKTIEGHKYEALFRTDLFTGMREGEIIGLTWDCVDFKNGYITVNKQLQLVRGSKGIYKFGPLKNDKSRRIAPAPSIMKLLYEHRRQQFERQIKADTAWNNSMNLVFTDEYGGQFFHSSVYKSFKSLVDKIGRADARFHDLRHTYAVLSLENGVDIKTLSENLGHATVAFTLDVYGHVSKRMIDKSASIMEDYFQSIKQA